MSKRQYPSVDYIRQCFRYENGKLFWRERPREHFKRNADQQTWNTKYALKIAGSMNNNRWRVGIDGSNYLRNHIVWAMHYGYHPDEIDHKNRVAYDDRIENLRVATRKQNNANRSLSRLNKSGVKGVSWYRNYKKWRAKIGVDGKKVHLGYFDNINDAATAYAKAAKSHFGRFSFTGQE